MKGVEEHEKGADTDNQAEYDGISPLAQVYPLKQPVDSREPIGDVVESGTYAFERLSLSHQVIPRLHRYAYLIVDQSIGTERRAITRNMKHTNASIDHSYRVEGGGV